MIFCSRVVGCIVPAILFVMVCDVFVVVVLVPVLYSVVGCVASSVVDVLFALVDIMLIVGFVMFVLATFYAVACAASVLISEPVVEPAFIGIIPTV